MPNLAFPFSSALAGDSAEQTARRERRTSPAREPGLIEPLRDDERRVAEGFLGRFPHLAFASFASFF